HLGVCASCREVVGLAGFPLVEPVPEPVRKRAIWEMPLFHWGAVAATVAVVVVAVSLGTRQAHKSPTAAILNETPPPQMATDKVVAEPSAQLEQDVTTKTAPTRRAPHLQERVRYERVTPQEPKGNAAAPAVGGAIMAGNVAPKVAAPQKAAAGPGALSTAADGTVSRDQLSYVTESGGQAQKDLRADLKQAPVAPPKPQAKSAPSAESAGAYHGSQPLSAAPQNETVQMNMAAAEQKTERQSSDEMVAKNKKADIARPRAMGPSNAFHEVRPITATVTGTQWQITNYGQLQQALMGQGGWQNMLSDHTFRSVAVVGDHIWAGGDNGLLYFSSDNGRNWKPLTVQSGNIALTGNIVHMRFDDDKQGTIDTSTGETWSTSDGGQSWQKQ
ncbi:MAG: hypothetical protein ACXVZX_11220, partial [Terriglobales bacterium]